ncbi:MAG: hypothetical protein MJK14_09675, partial [Rivularia sp. ALOHA_DT_140]|nr:hypothetical protein [Rivularia sp. ALOHA_DT_140]
IVAGLLKSAFLKPLYFKKRYQMASIAFIAGFSERLVEDVVIKTENTLTGFSSHTRKSDK